MLMRASLAGIVVATAMMYLRIDVVVAIFNLSLAWVLLPPLLGLFALAVLIAVWQWSHRQRSVPVKMAQLTAANPLQLGTALRTERHNPALISNSTSRPR